MMIHTMMTGTTTRTKAITQRLLPTILLVFLLLGGDGGSRSSCQVMVSAQQQQEEGAAAFVDDGTATTMHSFNFDNCDTASYYGSLSSSSSPLHDWTTNRDVLQAYLQMTHQRSSIDYTNAQDPGVDDVWAALMDVSVGSVPNTVSLLYSSQAQVDAIPFGQRSWIKEHVFPLGNDDVDLSNITTTTSAPEMVTDLHNIFPIDVLSDSIRESKYFAECSLSSSNDNDNCQRPAQGGADDTCSCSTIYTPPASQKGMIARALLYMDLRYPQQLRLTDCPGSNIGGDDDNNDKNVQIMAYKSQLLKWHAEYPPTPNELERNQKICQYWQGNRNPFVDVEELATALHGQPEEPVTDGVTATATERASAATAVLHYPSCGNVATPEPTPTPNACDTSVNPGDIMVFLLNTPVADGGENDNVGKDASGGIAMYTFATLPPGLQLYWSTNNVYNNDDGTDVVVAGNDEVTSITRSAAMTDIVGSDIIELTIPVDSDGVPPASVVGWNEPNVPFANDWIMPEGSNFTLARDDDDHDSNSTLFLYCQRANGDAKPLLAFLYGANATRAGNNLAIGTALGSSTNGIQIIDLPEYNLQFNASAVSSAITTEGLQDAMRNADYWMGNNESQFRVNANDIDGSFASSSSAVTAVAFGWTGGWVSTTALMMTISSMASLTFLSM